MFLFDQKVYDLEIDVMAVNFMFDIRNPILTFEKGFDVLQKLFRKLMIIKPDCLIPEIFSLI